MHRCLSGAILALLLVSPALADNQPASAPAPARHEVVVPLNFQKITLNGRTVITDDRDANWVKDALPRLKPATMPTTMPADFLARVKANRAQLIKRATTDLALPDDKAATEAVDQLIDRLQKETDLHPPIFYFVTTQPVLHALLQSGWEDPRFTYSRSTDRIEERTAIAIPIDRPMDDALVPYLFDTGMADDAREKIFLERAPLFEATMASQMSDDSMYMVFAAFATLADDKVFTPMKLPRDQEWLGMGVSSYLPVRILADLSGGDFDTMFYDKSHVPEKLMLRASSVDLIHPLKESILRPDYVEAYKEVMRRKSSAVVAAWVKSAGEGAIPAVLNALHGAPASSGEALVNLIKEKTDTDLSNLLTK